MIEMAFIEDRIERMKIALEKIIEFVDLHKEKFPHLQMFFDSEGKINPSKEQTQLLLNELNKLESEYRLPDEAAMVRVKHVNTGETFLRLLYFNPTSDAYENLRELFYSYLKSKGLD